MTADVESVLAAYVAAYRRRLAQRPAAFDAPVQNAVLTLLHLELGLRGGSRDALLGHLEAMAAASRPLLSAEAVEPPAAEIAGYAWASAYGSLPLLEPPVPQLEIVFSQASVVRYAGITANAWRALFVASAWPYLGYDLRAQAERDLAGRVAYLAERLDALGELPPQQVWQVAGVLAELAAALARADFAAAGGTALAAAQAPPEDAPTSRLAQLAAAARAVGDRGRADAVVGYLLRTRRDAASGLLLADAAGGRTELSPWVPLGLLAGTSSRPGQRAPADIAAGVGGEESSSSA